MFRSGTIDSLFGPTKNVWGSPVKEVLEKNGAVSDFNQWRIAGGSSGGSAVAVATGSVFALVLLKFVLQSGLTD